MPTTDIFLLSERHDATAGMNTGKWLAVLGVLLMIAVVSGGCRGGGGDSRAIVLYGFSIMEDVMKEEIIPAFQAYWKESTGEDIRVITSFAGSGTVTNQIIFGAPAQIAIVATEMDAMNIKEAGLIATDWRTFKNQGTFAYSVACILTREGNPKRIQSFDDTTGPGIDVVYPDPTTSGGAQWAILALYGSALKAGELSLGFPDHSGAIELLRDVTLNTGSLPESARRALTQFSLGYGDVLLTYENEALLDISSGKEYELIVPSSTIYIEPKVVIIDRNVDESEADVVGAFVDFLWAPETQEILAQNNFRVWNEEVMARHQDKYQAIQHPFTVEYLGGWEEATASIVDEAWKRVQREIR